MESTATKLEDIGLGLTKSGMDYARSTRLRHARPV